MNDANSGLESPGCNQVKITGGFWKDRLDLFRQVTVNDVFDKFEKDRGGAFNNYRRVIDGKSGYHAGPPWYDGLIMESIRGASDFLAGQYDGELDKRLDGYISLVARAQDAIGDGFANTYTTLMHPDKRWGENGGNLLWYHDLYDAGCLAEAGIHHYRATGKTALLTVAVKMANLIAGYMGEPPRKNIVPAHPLPEEAFFKLYSLFEQEPGLKEKVAAPVDAQAYFELAGFWIRNRGRHEGRASFPHYMGEYAQDQQPLAEQRHAVGHSVRAALLYTGLAEYVRLTGDRPYAEAAQAIWDDIVGKKMHINGGIGAEHNDERFGFEYYLPNNAYLETCANIALLFFGFRMYLWQGDAKYVDIMEQALYNGILSGISLKGDSYFYRNPLASDGDYRRWAWHECPCCPPMLLKVMGGLPAYIYAADKNGINVSMYIDSLAEIELAAGRAKLSQEGGYPWNGNVKIKIVENGAGSFALRLRIPGWCNSWRLSVNGGELNDAAVEKGFASIERQWAAGDTVELELDMPVTRMASHPYAECTLGSVALMKGPVLYCIEEADNDMKDVAVPACPEFSAQFDGALLGGVNAIAFEDTLYRPVKAIPYFAWANREAGKMEVWLKQEGYRTPDADQWGGRLYMPY